jgi:hypothetical protein
VTTALDKAGDRARRAGATALPAIQVQDVVFAGDEAVDQAAAALNGAR